MPACAGRRRSCSSGASPDGFVPADHAFVEHRSRGADPGYRHSLPSRPRRRLRPSSCAPGVISLPSRGLVYPLRAREARVADIRWPIVREQADGELLVYRTARYSRRASNTADGAGADGQPCAPAPLRGIATILIERTGQRASMTRRLLADASCGGSLSAGISDHQNTVASISSIGIRSAPAARSGRRSNTSHPTRLDDDCPSPCALLRSSPNPDRGNRRCALAAFCGF